MNAADTSASRAIADCTLLTVASRLSATAEMETFMIVVSTTRTNIAIASSSGRKRLGVAPGIGAPSTGCAPSGDVAPTGWSSRDIAGSFAESSSDSSDGPQGRWDTMRAVRIRSSTAHAEMVGDRLHRQA